MDGVRSRERLQVRAAGDTRVVQKIHIRSGAEVWLLIEEEEAGRGGLNCTYAKFIAKPLGALKREHWPITAKKVFY